MGENKKIGVTIQAAILGAIITVIGFIITGIFSCQANRLSKEALKLSKDNASFINDITKLKDLPRLEVYPIGVQFYTPTPQEVPGQVKIAINTHIKNLSEANAKAIALNIETKDWFDHYTNWFDVYKEINLPIPHIASLGPNTELPYPGYAPDAPNSGEAGYISQANPLLLKLTLYWNDNNNKKYVYVAFFKLNYSRLSNGNYLYFAKIESYDSVIDSDKAWTFSKKSLKNYQFITQINPSSH